MRIEQLKYFLAIDKYGSVNAASQHLYISQQGLSDALTRMESEVGLALFRRQKTGMSLTTEGKALLPYAQGVVEQYSLMENMVYKLQWQASPDENQVLTILSNPLSTSLLIPELFDIIYTKMPELSLHYKDTPITEMVTLTQAGNADLCLFLLLQWDIADFFETLPKNVGVYKLFDDEMVACISSTSPLASRKYLTVSELNTLPMSNFNNSYNFSSFSNDNTKYSTSNFQFQLNLILQKGAAGTTASSFFKRTFPTDLVVALPIKPAIQISYYVMVAKQEPTENMKMVLRELAEYIFQLTGQRTEILQ